MCTCRHEQVVGEWPTRRCGDGGGEVIDGRIQHVRGAKPLRRLPFAGYGINGDDRRGTGDAGGLDGADTDPSAAHDHHGVALRHSGGVGHGSRTGQDPAAQEACLDKVHVVGEQGHLRTVDHDLGGEAGHVEALGDAVAVGIGQGAAGGECELAAADHVMSPPACPTFATGPDEGDEDRITGGQVVHAAAGLGDASGGLVAQDQRECGRPCSVHIAQVGVAYGAGLHDHAYLACAGRVEMEILDTRRQADAAAYRRTDGGPTARRHGAQTTPLRRSET